jgi:hypothetical protein
MDQTDSGSNTFQTLASVLAGGLGAYVDSQNQQPVYVTQPTPQTQYGVQGQNQNTGTIAGLSPMVLLLVVGVVAFIALKK